MSIDRADLLRASTTLTGIDFIRVSPAQTDLFLFLQHDGLSAGLATALAAIGKDAFHITAEGAVDPARVPVIAHVTPLPAPIDGRAVLQVKVAAPGGFGFYRLFIDDPAIDPFFNNVRFSFKAGCDSALDCAAVPEACPPAEAVDFPVDYRARDFWSHRQALIDFAAQRYPDWQDRLEADIGMMLLELTAALGDEFAYANDRLNREMAIDTATQRRSLRQLAALVDYPIDDGAGARAWIVIQALAAGSIDAGTPISDRHGQLPFEIGKGLRDRPMGTPPLPPPPPVTYAVDPGRNALRPYIWDENASCAPAGSTQIILAGAHAALLQPDAAIDPRGRWVALMTHPVSPDLPERRLVVRLDVPVDDVDPLTAAPITRLPLALPLPVDIDLDTLVLHANVIPATSGATREARFRIGPASDPADPDASLPLAIERVGPGSTLCYPVPGSPSDLSARVKTLFPLAGSDVMPLVWHASDTGTLLPEVELVAEGDRAWAWRPSLVGETTAEPDSKLFTLDHGIYRRVIGFDRGGKRIELVDYAGNDGTTLRFGDDVFGMAPAEGALFRLRYRLGNGSRMNVAADTLVVIDSPFVGSATNPVAATGGRDPESAQAIRTNAPQAWQALTYRAVRPEDHATIAERIADVQKAGAVSRWTGSWSTIFVTPDPRGATRVSDDLRQAIDRSMDRVRQAGREVRQLAPRYADFDLEIRLCVAANAYRGDIKALALQALFGPQGNGGFFDPDHFTFGTPLSRAALVAALQAVPGIRAVEAMQVRRRGYFDWRAFQEMALPVGINELVRVANDRMLPERGSVRLVMKGGA